MHWQLGVKSIKFRQKFCCSRIWPFMAKMVGCQTY